jgi:hypothetical protein
MKKSKLDRFFKIIICIVISFTFWSLNKLSKKTKNNISLKLNIVDLPENLSLDSISYKQINVKLAGRGTQKSKKKEINITGKNILNGILPINKNEVESQLESHLNIIDIYPDTIFVYTSKKELKKVPVKHNILVNLNKNYWLKNEIKIEPDSLVIKGNKRDLNKINFLETEELKLLNVDNKKTGTIYLKENLFFSNKTELSYEIDVEKYTEGEIKIKIETVNFPTNKEVLLFPNRLKLRYLVSEENYNKIKEEDFKIICDLENIDIKSKECFVSIIKKPKNIQIAEFNKKIKFLIQ